MKPGAKGGARRSAARDRVWGVIGLAWDRLGPRVASRPTERERRMTAFTYDHIHLRSPDAEATALWYENMFGAEIIRSVQSDGRPRLDLNLGGVAVFIAQV